MQKLKIGIIGATGMVGQRFVSLLQNHPWFEITHLAASSRSAGRLYADLMESRWTLSVPFAANVGQMRVLDAEKDAKKIAAKVDFVFCAVDMPKEQTREFENMYARLECPVVSNNSAHRHTPDVPMIIPEVNAEHAAVIAHQRKRLGTKRGFIAVKCNCSLVSYVPALDALRKFGLERALVCTYQAISGAGKTFETWQEMTDNVIPYIGGEEEKSEREPLKIWGRVENGVIKDAAAPQVTAQCIRVPVTDGHMAAAFASFTKRPDLDEIKRLWNEYSGEAQRLGLPSAPKQFLRYFEEPDYPQTRLHRDLENGMAVSIGRLRADTQYDIKFVSLSHNTLRGAAGGGVLLAELLCKTGHITKQ